MNESSFFNSLLKPRLKSWGDYCRVENSVGNGIPDVNYAIQNIEGWIETKVSKGQFLYFEKFQIPWIKKRIKHSRTTWVLALCGDEINLYSGDQISNAEREPYRKWVRIKYKELTPVLSLTKPYKWDLLKLYLINQGQIHD